MPDGISLEELRAAAQPKGLSLDEVRSQTSQGGLSLDQVRANTKKPFFSGVSTDVTPGTTQPGPAFARPELETQKSEAAMRGADERAIGTVADTLGTAADEVGGRVINAGKAAIEPIAEMFGREREASDLRSLRLKAEAERARDYASGKPVPPAFMPPEPPGYFSRIWSNLKETPGATFGLQPETIALNIADPGIVQGVTEKVIRPVARGVGGFVEGAAELPAAAVRSAADNYPKAEDIRDVEAQSKPEERGIGPLTSTVTELALQMALLKGAGKVGGKLIGKGRLASPPAEPPVRPAEAVSERGTPPAKGLVVAARDANGNVYYGKPGDLHYDLYSEGRPKGMENGFAGPDGKFLTREEALAASDVKTPDRGFGLDAKDYQEATARAAKGRGELVGEDLPGVVDEDGNPYEVAMRPKRTAQEHLAAVEDLKRRMPGLSTRDAADMLRRQDEAAPRAEDVPPATEASVPAEAAAPPTGGAVTLGANRLVSPEMAKKAEGWIEGVEKPVVKGTKTIGGKLREAFPRIASVTDYAYDKLLRSREGRIGKQIGAPDFEPSVAEGRRVGGRASLEANRAVELFEKTSEGMTNKQMLEVGKSLNSENADLSWASQDQLTAIEAVRKTLNSLRERDKLSEEAFSEYPQGRLSRILKPGILGSVQRRFARMKGIGVDAYKTAKDMPGIRLKISAAEAQAIVDELGVKPRYLKELGGKTQLKFDNTPEGVAARDAFYDAVKEKFGEARSKLSEDATREIKAGDVQQAKMLQTAQGDVPRVGDLGVEKWDAIPEDVAAKIFNQDPGQRLHSTMQTSARRIGKGAIQEQIAALKNAKGEDVVRIPENLTDALHGREAPPEGYELLNNKDFGVLNHKFVPKEVAEYVRGETNGKQAGFARGVMQGLMERFKVARLLYNPRQAIRQYPSNMEFENYAGISNWGPRYAQHKLRGLKAMAEGSPYHDDLVANGFLDPAYVSKAELGLAERELGSGPGDLGRRIGRAIGSFGLTEVAPNKLASLESKLGRFYGAADAWTKATIYAHAIEELDMSPKDAAAHVRKWTPSPESVSDAIRYYSGHIVGDPWARYRAEQARITLQGMKEHPARFLMNYHQKNLIRTALLASGASPLSDDEKQAMESEQGQGALAVGRDEKNRPLGIDYSFLSTATDLFDTPSDVGKGGEHTAERILDITGLGDNPGLGFIVEQTSRRKFKRGWGPINPEGSGTGALKALGEGIIAPFVPSLASNHIRKLEAAWKGEPYSPNRPPQTKAQALLDVFLGVHLEPLDAQQALDKIGKQGRRAIDDVLSENRGRLLRGQAIDEDEINRFGDAVQAEYDKRAAPLERIAKGQK